MCCRSHVNVLDNEALSFVMERGLFVPTFKAAEAEYASTWERRLPEEGTCVTVSCVGGNVSFSLSPSISIYAHHLGKRLAAGVLFEVASKYAMAVNGQVVQNGLVGGCRAGVKGDVVIASYPEHHLTYDDICAGFRAVLMGETEGFPLEGGDEAGDIAYG